MEQAKQRFPEDLDYAVALDTTRSVTQGIKEIVITLLIEIPVSPGAALHLAGNTGHLRVFDFSPSLTNTYTFWSGLIGGTFLMLSYFGTDQSQVQRYLAAKSVPEARTSLLMSAYWKIPLQALVLLVGVLVFVFYNYHRPPLLFNPAQERAVRLAEPSAYATLDQQFTPTWIPDVGRAVVPPGPPLKLTRLTVVLLFTIVVLYVLRTMVSFTLVTLRL